ncbi:MAG: iron-containing alcohol dehydrogenase [Pseudomonadota bacterium]
MTLITYSTRVHFADGILEEAIWSEVEAKGRKRPLLIGSAHGDDAELLDRIIAGLPVPSRAKFFADIPRTPRQRHVQHIADTFRREEADVLIAFGGSTAIDLAKLARLSLSTGSDTLDLLTHFEGAAARRHGLPDLIAIPDNRGLGPAVSAYAPVLLESGSAQRVISSDLIPDVTICDPSIAADVSPDDQASAVAEALARCLEAYLSPGYNPPAEGIAFDGFKRVVDVLSRPRGRLSREARRDVMAANLNGALALQKDLGATHALAMVLRIVADRDLDAGAVCRIILPRMLEVYEEQDRAKTLLARRAVGFSETASLADGLLPLLRELPLPSRLSELGVREADIVEAAHMAETEFVGRGHDLGAQPGRLRAVMASVH